MTLQVTFAPQAAALGIYQQNGALNSAFFLLPEQQDMQKHSTAVQALHCTDCIRVGKMQQKKNLSCARLEPVFSLLTAVMPAPLQNEIQISDCHCERGNT